MVSVKEKIIPANKPLNNPTSADSPILTDFLAEPDNSQADSPPPNSIHKQQQFPIDIIGKELNKPLTKPAIKKAFR